MKLHLPGKLRAALMACYAICASLVTTVFSGSLVGGALVASAAAIAASQQAYAAPTIVFDGGSITDFNYGSVITDTAVGDVSFSKDDNITFLKDTSLSMGGNVTAGIFGIGKDVVLDISSNGYRLDAAFDIKEGVLRLSSDVLDEKAEVYRSNAGRVEIAWGSASASMAKQLASFTGLLDINDTTYEMGERETSYTKLVLHGSEGNGAMLTQSATYTLPIVSIGDTTIGVGDNSTIFTGLVSGFGAITKTGPGTLTFKANHGYHYGDLIIDEGIVRWGSENDAAGTTTNKLSFSNIVVNRDATFVDSHMGRSMVNTTAVTLNNGTIMSFEMGAFKADAWDDLTVNTYKALYVQEAGTIAVERSGGHRFAVLSSLNGEAWQEGNAPDSTTLTITNGTEYTTTIIDRIENFHGTITSMGAMNADHQFHVYEAHQDAGYAVSIDVASTAFGFAKTGEGDVTFTGPLKAEDAVSVSGGTLQVRGILTAEGVDVSAGRMIVEQNASMQTLTVTGSGEFRTDSRTVTLSVADEVRVSGGTLTVGSESTQLKVDRDVIIAGGTTLINGSLQAGDVYITGGADTSFTIVGDVTVDSLEKTGAAQLVLPEYGEDKSHLVKVGRRLTMNYGGTADSFNGGNFDMISPENGVVLKYYSGASNVVKLGYGRNAEQKKLGYMFADVFDVTAADLAKGINLGIESEVHPGEFGSRVEHLFVSTLGKKDVDYKIYTGDDGYYYLKTLHGQTASTTWDINWGTEEVSSAPEVVRPWVYTSIDDTGLYGSPYDDDGYFIASELVGSNAVGAPGNGSKDPVTGEVKQSAVNVFGGAHDSVDPEGATIERDVWLKVSDGNFALVAGGSMCGGQVAVAGWSLVGDTHIYVAEEVDTIGSVVAGNFLNAYDPQWQGDGYVSINTAGLTGSVFGGGYNSISHEGDSTIYVYKALMTDTPTKIDDYTIGDTEMGMGLSITMNTIGGGLFAGKTSQWIGDGKVVIDLQNDTTSNRMAKSIVGGNFGSIADNDTLSRVGNNHVLIQNTCVGDGSRLFSNYIVGGDIAILAGSYMMTGDTYVEFRNLGSLTYIGGKGYNTDNPFVVGGYMALDSAHGPMYTLTSNFTLVGNTHLKVTAAENGIFNANLVAGHATSRDKLWDNSAEILSTNELERLNVSTIEGDTYIDIDSGIYKGVVVGGHYYEDFIHDALPDNPGQVPVHPKQGTEPDTLTITGTTHINLTGGSYRNMVLGASYYDGWDNVTMYTGGVVINVDGCTMGDADLNGTTNAYNYAVVGGYYIDEYLHGTDVTGPYSSSNPHSVDISATLGDINLTFADTTVNGIILGGSHILRSHVVDPSGVRQGNIVVDLKSGTFNKNIYAAGCQYSDVDLYTESTTVKISDEVVFGQNVTVCGGYMGSGASAVHGDTTLEFTSASKYDNIAGTNFIFFDVVKVTEERGHVVLPHNTTLLGDYLTKRGAGTLELGVQNKLDMLTVAEGTLKLAANSGNTASGTKIEQLNLCKGATIDLTAGNCGINGDLVIEGGSTVMIGTGLIPTAIERLIWDDSEKVMLTLSALPTGAESYVVELFSGLTKADIVGLDMRTLDVGYGVRASQYIDSNVDLTNSYLLLEGDTLVLTRAPRRSIFWEYKGGTNGYWMSENAWAKTDEGTPNTMFNNEPGSDNVVFSNNTATITVNQEVMPYDIYIRNGEYTFTGEGKEAVITPYGSIVLSEGAKATFTEFVTLNTSADTTLIALQDEACSLEVNNDIAINQLQSQGMLVVNGSLSIANGTNHGGVLVVNEGDLTVGGDTTFSELQVEGAVKNNSDFVLTTDGLSSIGSIDGGVVGVLKGGELTINPNGEATTTSLKALQGTGALSTKNRLVLSAAGKIGDLTAESLVLKSTLQSTGSVMVTNDLAVSDSVTVTGALTADSITYDNLILKSGYAMIDVEQNVYTSAGTSKLQMNVDTSMIATKILSDGQEYYLLKCDEGGLEADVVFGADGATTLQASNDRYDYSAYTVNDGVVLKADLINPNLFEDAVAETPNGITGGIMLDELYKNASILEQYPNGDLALTMEAINQQLMVNNSKEGLDDLFAAVAGASIPAMGVAFADDINRQMQAIRNRTTTMGVDQGAVNEGMPYFNAWINAEGGNRNLDEDGTSSGYDLSSWGGTVGFDVDFTPRFTAGIAVSAMYGDYTANAPDDAEGDFDTQYVTAFARYGYRSWVHTFVASVGRADATLERTVSHQYGSYRTKGETDGMGFGLMYEVGYVRALNETGTACIQPVMNFALTKASLDGYTEEGSDAALEVGEIDMTTFTVGAGARIQAVIGENLYNRASIFECRALAKFRAGDRNAETDVGFAAAAMGTGTVESAEMGNVGIELGAGIVVPLGADHSSVFADVSAEFSSGYTSVNGTVGYRINF